jgi:hypothetical protein
MILNVQINNNALHQKSPLYLPAGRQGGDLEGL